MLTTTLSYLTCLALFASRGLASCPGPNGEVEDGKRIVGGHFVLECRSDEESYQLIPVGCATQGRQMLPWNSNVREQATIYHCVESGNKKYLSIGLISNGNRQVVYAPKVERGLVPSQLQHLGSKCFIPGVGPVRAGKRVEQDYLVYECSDDGEYQVTACVLSTGARIPVDESIVVKQHRWTCSSTRGGLSAQLSKIPLRSSADRKSSTNDDLSNGCTPGDSILKRQFRMECIRGAKSKPTWTITHCRLHNARTLIPVDGSVQRGPVTFRCSKISDSRVQITFDLKGKSNDRPFSSLKTKAERPDREERRERRRENRCEDPCKFKGQTVCRGEDEMVARNRAGDSRIRCSFEGQLESYCRVKVLGRDDFYELLYGTYTEVDGRFLACAQFDGQSNIQPGNTAPANSIWRARLEAHRYQYTPAHLLKKK